MQADPAALANLGRLLEVQGLLEQGRDRLSKVRKAIRGIEDQVALKGEEAEADDLAELLGLDVEAPTEADLTPVEAYARQKELQALFEALDAQDGQ